MNLYLDLDTGVFCSSPGARDTVSSLSFKRGDTVSIAVRFISGITVQELGVGATGKLGLKEEGEYDADFVASDTAWTKTGTGTSTVYTFVLNLNTSEINALLNDDGTEGNDIASVELMMEMEWTVDGVTTSSNTITATIQNDVVKGDESGPTEIRGGTPVNQATATGTLDFVGNAVADETVTIGATVYTFKASAASAGQVTIGVNATATILNLIDEVNGDGIGSANASATAAVGVLADTMDVTAIEPGADGNSVATTETMTNGSWGAATLTGGVTATSGVLGSMQVDSSYLYVVCSVSGDVPTWKKIALTSL